VVEEDLLDQLGVSVLLLCHQLHTLRLPLEDDYFLAEVFTGRGGESLAE